MSSCSPGPWHIGGNALDVRDTNEDNVVTVSSRDDPEKAEANARLISAAPELLDALHEAKEYLGNMLEASGEDSGEGETITRWNALIAKASPSA